MSRAMAVAGALAAVCIFLYGFFLLEAVAHTASRTQAQGSIRALNSKLSSLEETYLSKSRELTLEHAHALGFVTPKEVSTVYVNDKAGNLSLRGQ
jgi:hypothetical protein